MSSPFKTTLRERNVALAHEVRALQDDDLERRLLEVGGEATELRRKLDDANALLEALAVEKDRRAVQRRAG